MTHLAISLFIGRVEEMPLFSAATVVSQVGRVVDALAGIALELRELRRSVDHHAIVTSRPELFGRASEFYLEHEPLVKH